MPIESRRPSLRSFPPALSSATFFAYPVAPQSARDAEPHLPFPPLPCFGAHGFRQTQLPLVVSRIRQRRLAFLDRGRRAEETRSRRTGLQEAKLFPSHLGKSSCRLATLVCPDSVAATP
ncbi:hypothetical protein P7K49_020940 [Saguinus oedipus]|uniref:Uncharacterized protein n=1 Tax=Saguinus oedipus TaxID=9490 RepID=A0ABQ9UTJ6_SAGOE|nr:hypothetical protein P7K49_020940 [Saguinus oedipus]